VVPRRVLEGRLSAQPVAGNAASCNRLNSPPPASPPCILSVSIVVAAVANRDGTALHELIAAE
jgi:hypothetical protein